MTGLRKHFVKNHSNMDCCPICKKEVHSIPKHLMKMRDDDHLILWYLYNNFRGLKNNQLKTRVRKLAKEKLVLVSSVII